MIHKLFIVVLLFLLTVSCTTLKVLKTVTQGKVKQTNYLEEIPFIYYNDIIIVALTIDGANYHFIYDTGNDLTTINGDVVDKIKTTSNNVSNETKDGNNVSTKNKYISINNITIGNINFENTGAQIFDHSIFEQILGCDLKISGILGSNLMRKAKWQIDYTNKTIRFSDKIGLLNVTNEHVALEIYARKYGSAILEMQLNGVRDDYNFDTGFSGFIAADLTVFDSLNSSNEVQHTKSLVTTYYGNGKAVEENVDAYIKGIDMGRISRKNQIVNFSKGSPNIIGNKFWENYLVTMDWQDKQLYLKPIKEMEPGVLNQYEYKFAPNFETNKFAFYNKWNEHNLENAFSLEVEILSINGINVENLTNETLCSIWKNQKDNLLTDVVEMEIMENGVKRKIKLTKKQLLPK